MGFFLDYDQWEIKDKRWIRFKLENRDIEESNLRWIWYRNDSLSTNFSTGAKILFKAGQKAFKHKLNDYVEL